MEGKAEYHAVVNKREGEARRMAALDRALRFFEAHGSFLEEEMDLLRVARAFERYLGGEREAQP